MKLAPEQSGPVVTALLQLKEEGEGDAALALTYLLESPTDLQAAIDGGLVKLSDDGNPAHVGGKTIGLMPKPASKEVALAGADGKELSRLIRASKLRGIQVMADVTRGALERYTGGGPLLNTKELHRLGESIAAVNSMGDLMGRARVREMAENVERSKGGLHRMTDAPFHSFAEPAGLPVITSPFQALQYFVGLVPKVGTNPERFVGEQRRRAFTLAESANQVLTARVQAAISAGLAGNSPVSEGRHEIETLLHECGVHPDSPSYSDMCYRTNAMDAYQTAAYEEGREPEMQEIFPCWQYLGIDDHRAGVDHRPHFGKYYPSHATFADVRGPRGFNCRCSLRWVDKYEWADLQKSGHTLSEWSLAS